MICLQTRLVFPTNTVSPAHASAFQNDTRLSQKTPGGNGRRLLLTGCPNGLSSSPSVPQEKHGNKLTCPGRAGEPGEPRTEPLEPRRKALKE